MRHAKHPNEAKPQPRQADGETADVCKQEGHGNVLGASGVGLINEVMEAVLLGAPTKPFCLR